MKRTTTPWASALLIVVALMATSCAAADELKKIHLPPIAVTLPEKPAPPVVSPPVVEPDPAPAPAPQAELPPPVDERPLVNLNIVVHDAVTGAGIHRATCTVGDDSRAADGGGFINFAVRGPVLVRCAAGGYQARPAIDMPPGDHRFPLAPIAPPAPPPAPLPPVVVTPPASGEIVPGQLSIGLVVAIARRVHDAEGWFLGEGSSRDQRNRFWERVVGIVHFGHPVYNRTADARWHLKDGGNGRPQSDDVIVLMPGREFWDCIPSAGAGRYDPNETNRNSAGEREPGYRFSAAGHTERLPIEQNVYPPRKPAQGAVRP